MQFCVKTDFMYRISLRQYFVDIRQIGLEIAVNEINIIYRSIIS